MALSLEECQRKVGEIVARYARELPGKCLAIRAAWARYREGDPAALGELAGMAHKLAGSGRTFGFPAVSLSGRDLERLAQEVADGKPLPAKEFEDAIGNLEAACAAPASGGEDLGKALVGMVPQGRPRTVLIVDDDRAMGEYCATLFRARGLECVLAASAAEADRRLDGAALALVDVRLPDASGYEWAARTRSRGEFSGLPFVFYSADPAAGKPEGRGFESDKFLSKPFDPAALVGAVLDGIARSRCGRG